MGFVGGLLGTAGGQNGTGVQGPSQANILNPTNVNQANQQYGNAQAALGQQQSFVNAVNQANGVGNQSQVFNALQGVANGTGPNPAQAQLAQATGANVANQAALMAGQRGSGANVGLLARQAAQQGAATQQQAAGQAASLQSQQQLNALNAQGNIATNQANQQANAVQGLNTATQGEQGQILGSIAAQNNANVGMQSNINTANAGLTGQTMQGQQNLLGNVAGGLGSALGLAQGGMIPKYADGGGVAPATTQLQGAPPSASQGPQSAVGQHFFAQNNPTQAPLTGASAAGNTIGKGLGMGLKAGYNALFGPSNPGTSVSGTPGSASLDQLSMPGGVANNDVSNTMAGGMGDAGGLTSNTGPAATADMGGAMEALAAQGGMLGQITQLAPVLAMMAAEGGKVPALVSPGEQYLPPKEAKEVVKGKKDPLKTGERIPGKPKFPGNDYRNDTVPKTLEAGGIVIPNEVMQSKHPHWAAMKFVQATMAKNGKLPPKPGKK